MVVYIQTKLDDTVCTYFLRLLITEDNSSLDWKKFATFLHKINLSHELLNAQFIGFCSNEATCMIGQHKGLATLLKAKYSTANIPLHRT